MITVELAHAVVVGSRRRDLALAVLYDEQCPLCRRLRAWLGAQPTLVPVEFVAAASPEARTRFPELDHERTTRVLTVVAGDGAVYEEERAWLLCAWSLPRWRPLAENLGSGWRLGLVRIAAKAVDGVRHRRPAASRACRTCGAAA